MTCIVGLVADDTVLIGGDGLSSLDSQVSARGDPKVFTNGPLLLGCAGSFRVMQVLRYGLHVPEQADDLTEHAYLCAVVIPAIRAALRDAGCLDKDERGSDSMDCEALIGYRGRLSVLSSDFNVGEPVKDYHALGSGREYALGSLWSTVERAPDVRVTVALGVAGEFCGSVGPPYTVALQHAPVD